MANVLADQALNVTNEFTLIRPGTAASYNDRSPILSGAKIALRNRFARFLVVLPGTTIISSEEFSEGGLPQHSLHSVTAFCPVGANGKVCTGNGSCDRNRCTCKQEFLAHDCSMSRVSASCHVAAGVHWKTFDDLWYTTRSVGEYIMAMRPGQSHNEMVSVLLTDPTKENAPKSNVTVAPTETIVSSVMIRRDEGIIKFTAGKGIFIDCETRDITAAVDAAGAGGFETDSGMMLRSLDVGTGMYSIESISGLEVTVHVIGSSINVWVHINEPRTGALQGLCGNFNGIRSDDLGSFGADSATLAVSNKFVDQFTIVPDMSLASCGKNSFATNIITKDPKQAVAFLISGVSISGLSALDIAQASRKQITTQACGGETSKAFIGAEKECKSLFKNEAPAMQIYNTCLIDACSVSLSSASRALATDLGRGDRAQESNMFIGEIEELPAGQFPPGLQGPFTAPSS